MQSPAAALRRAMLLGDRELLFEFRPAVLERQRSVESQLAGRGIAVDAEVAHALELIELTRNGRSKVRFDLAAMQHLQRLRVQVGQKVLPLGRLGRVLAGEQAV